MLALAASLFVFLAIVAGAVALFSSTRTRRTKVDQRIRELRAKPDGERERPSAVPTLRRPHSSIPLLGRALTGSAWADAVVLELQQANVQLRVGEYVLARALTGAVALLLIALVFRFHPLGLALGVGAAAIGYMVPAVYISMLRRRRIDAIERQLIELAPMLASGLRAGFGLQQAMELAARQLEPPIADELNLLINDVNLGATMEAALQDLGRRAGCPDLDMLTTAIIVQRSSGGNLAEILDQTSETLRERERIRGELRTLTAQQRLTGAILSVYPAAIGLLLLAVMPSVWSVLFTRAIGQIFLGIALGLQVLGFFAMRRVMNIQI